MTEDSSRKNGVVNEFQCFLCFSRSDMKSCAPLQRADAGKAAQKRQLKAWKAPHLTDDVQVKAGHGRDCVEPHPEHSMWIPRVHVINPALT